MKNSLLRVRIFVCPSGSLFSDGAKWPMLAALSLLLIVNAHATLYLLEPFDYAPGPLTNAIPWSTNGTLVEAIPTQLIVPGDLSYPPLNQPAVTNSAALQWSSNVKGERAIPGGPYGDPVNGGSVYCSFYLYKATTNFSTANLPIAAMLDAGDANTINSANAQGIVLNERGTNGGYQLGIKLGGGVNSAVYPPGGQVYTPGDTNLGTFGQTNFVVMKYTFVPGAANDTVALWVDPDPGSFGGSEPAATTNDVAATNASGFNADSPAGLGLFQIRGGSGGTAGVLQMDNLRIGSTWADVTPTCITAGIASNTPASQSTSPGQTATFTVTATGANPTFQWQTNNGSGWASITGATNVSYTTPPEVLSDNGLQFRCIVSVACDNSSVTSAAATLTVENCVTAGTTDPGNQSVSAGSTATFSVTASGTHPTLQWQSNNGGGWVNIGGATNASYTTPPEPLANNGLQFRCVVGVACNSSTATSAAATLTVVCNTAQVSSLQNVTVTAGQTATFSVTSTSSNPTFQWATNNGGGWVNIPGATNASYTTPPTTPDEYGLQFQCTVSVACDGSSTSTAATLLVNCFSAAVNTDINNTTVALGAGQTVTFVFTATGSLPAYQWQTNNGSGWVNITGATNTTYTTPPQAVALNGLQYQCVATVPCDGSTAVSSTATVSVYSDNAEFLSVANGNIGDPNSWKQSFDNGATFNNPALYPPADINSTNTVVQNGNTVTAATSGSLNHVVVQSGGQISINTGATITLTTNGGGTALDVSGLVDVTGTLTINAGASAVVESGGTLKLEQGGVGTENGTLTFKSGAVYLHNWTTTPGIIPTATWNAGSSCQVIGFTTDTGTFAGQAQTFYNLVWNCINQSSAVPWGGTVPTVNGDFTFTSSGTGEVRISNNNSPAMNVLGNFNLQGGHLTFASGTGKPTMNLSGNAVLSGGMLSNSLTSTGATVNFVKAGAQSYSNTGTTIIGPINWVVQSNSILQISGTISSNLTVAAGGTLRLTTNTSLFQLIGNLTANGGGVLMDLGGATLGNGTYPLMTYSGNFSGAFKSPPTIVNGSLTGTAYISTLNSNQVNLVVVSVPTQPKFANVTLAGTSLTVTASNGLPGDSFGLLASTNVTLPLNQWTPVLRNGVFDSSGNLNVVTSINNALGTNVPQEFFIIQMPSP